MSPKKSRLPPFPSVAPLVKRTLLVAGASVGIGGCAGPDRAMPPQVVDPPQAEYREYEDPAIAGDAGTGFAEPPPPQPPPQPPPPQIDRDPPPQPPPPPPPQVAPPQEDGRLPDLKPPPNPPPQVAPPRR